jgi:CRP-like cAMP-binding protein
MSGERTTMTDRVWYALTQLYQPTTLNFDESGLGTRIPKGVKQPKSHALGPRLTLTMLAVARVIDTGWANDVTAAQVAEILGGPASTVSRSLAELERTNWLTFTVGPRTTKRYTPAV